MTQPKEPLPPFLAEPSKLGQEISVTGKWIPTKKGGVFRKSAESREMLQEWEDIHADARADAGVLSTEINHAVGDDAVLVHHVFKDADALVHYFSTTATQHMSDAHQGREARPTPHSWRSASQPPVREALVGEEAYRRRSGSSSSATSRRTTSAPTQQTAINVTAKWTCKPGEASSSRRPQVLVAARGDRRVHSMEEGLLRFEAYQVIGEDALIIHETFERQRRAEVPSHEGHRREVQEGHRPDRGARGLLLPWPRLVDHQDVLQVPASAGHVLEPRKPLHPSRGNDERGNDRIALDENCKPNGEIRMPRTHITVVYKWTANPGKLDELATSLRKTTPCMSATSSKTRRRWACT